jgi:hypothetical protein
MFSSANPFMAMVKTAADQTRKDRRPVATDNPFLAMQAQMSKQIVDGLDAWREAVEKASEDAFLRIYGSPVLQAALGIDTQSPRPPRKAAKNLLHQDLMEMRIAELKSKMSLGGLPEAFARSLIYVGMARGSADERGLAAIRRLRETKGRGSDMTLDQFKSMIRDQFFMLVIDEKAAVAAIADLLPDDRQERIDAFRHLQTVLAAGGELGDAATERLAEIGRIFGGQGPGLPIAPAGLAASPPAHPGAPRKKDTQVADSTAADKAGDGPAERTA